MTPDSPTLPFATSLLNRFQDGTLPHQEWTHRAHLYVAASYLKQASPEKVLPRLRTEIQRLNLAHGVLTTAQRGYHETLTRMWICLVEMSKADLGSGGDIDAVVDACAACKGLPLEYYSKDRLLSWEARIGWVSPDLKALPLDPGSWEEGTPPLFTLASAFP